MITRIEDASTDEWVIRCACGDRLTGIALLSAKGGGLYEPDTITVQALPANRAAVSHLNACTVHNAIPEHGRLKLRTTVVIDAGSVPIDGAESYIDIAVRDHLITEARRER